MRLAMHAARDERHGSDGGFVAMITVILIGAIILSIGMTAAFVGQTETSLAGQADREWTARSLAQTCVDEAMQRLKMNAGYVGGTVPVGLDSCTVTVSGSGTTRTIVAIGASDVFTKTITVAASLKTNAAGNASAWHVDSWTEGDPP